MWTNAVTVDVCKECGEDIYPGERILRTFYREPDVWFTLSNFRVTLCEGCGELFVESVELGNNEESETRKPRERRRKKR